MATRVTGVANLQRSGLKISALTKCVAGRPVLDAVSLQVEPGCLTALLGPAGSGKSMLLRILAGFGRADSGQVELNGMPIGRLAPHRRGFGVVRQPDLLFPHLSLAENVAFPLRMRSVKRRARTGLVEAALDMVQLGCAASLLPEAASPAERQRAMLARATIFEPRVLLLDDPLSDQDQAARGAFMAALRRIHDMLGSVTLLATRSGTDAMALGDQVVVMRAGTIEQAAPPEEIFDRPRNVFVASLLGETNRLPGTVVEIYDDIMQVLLECGPVVEAARGRTLEAGDHCLVALRPDRIAIAALPAAEMGGDAIDVTLIDVQFQGDLYRLRLLIGSGAELIVKRPASAGLRGLAVGQTASVAWQSQHATAFATTEATGGRE